MIIYMVKVWILIQVAQDRKQLWPSMNVVTPQKFVTSWSAK